MIYLADDDSTVTLSSNTSIPAHCCRMESPANESDLLTAFRTYHHRFVQSVQEAVLSSADSTVLHRLGDQIDEYSALVNQV